MARAVGSVSPTFPTRSPTRPFITVDVGKGSVTTSPIHTRQPWPTVMKRAMAESQLASFIAYSTPKSGAVDHWKKLAKKAEFELILERDSHRADNTKNNITIHRINQRLIPLEKALCKSKEGLKQQEKLVNYLKCQLMGANERKSSEVLYLRHQTDALQKRLLGVTNTNEQKIVQLQEELEQAKSRARSLQEQMNAIFMHADEGAVTEVYSGSLQGSKDVGVDSDKYPQQMGLVILAKIYKMQLSRQSLTTMLKESEERNIQLVQESGRLRTLAQESVLRSNKFMDLAKNLKADRDLTMTQLKDTEAVLKSLEALNERVHSYISVHEPKATFLSQEILPGNILLTSTYQRQQSPLSSTGNRKQEVLQSSSTADLETSDSVMMEVPQMKVVYFKDDGGAGVRSAGTSLFKKLQEVFDMLVSKVEMANQTAAMSQKQRDELHVTVLDAYQELTGQKSMKLNSPDDVALGLLLAVQQLKLTLEGLEKENVVLRASKSKEDEKLMQSQSQVDELTVDRITLLQTLEGVKSAIRASDAEQDTQEYIGGLCNSRVIQCEDISEMVEKLVFERNGFRSMSEALQADKFVKEKDLSDLRSLYAESQALVTRLQGETNLLKKEQDELKAVCQGIMREKIALDTERKMETDKKVLELQSQIHGLALDKSSLLEILEAIKNTIQPSSSGQGNTQYFKGFLKSSLVQHGDVEVLDIVEQFVIENEKTKVMRLHLMEEIGAKERELGEITLLLNQSNMLSENLTKEKDLLQHDFFELQRSTNILKTKTESFDASSSEMEETNLQLQTQIKHLTSDKAMCLEMLDTLKKVFVGSESRTIPQHQKSSLHSSAMDENFSELLGMAETLVDNRNEARFRGTQVMEEKELKEKELSDLRNMYSQSTSFCTNLQNEKDELVQELKTLQNAIRSIEGSFYGGSSPDTVILEDSRNPLKSGALISGKLVTEISALKEQVDRAKLELLNERKLFEGKIQEMRFVIGTETDSPRDWESKVAAMILSLKALKEQSVASLRDCRELYNVVEHQVKKLVEIMMAGDRKQAIPIEDENQKNSGGSDPVTVEGKRMSIDVKKVINDLTVLVKEVENLKREKDEVVASLLSVELEKDTVVRRSSEHQDKILKLCDDSQHVVNELRQQLNAALSLLSSVPNRGSASQNLSEDLTNKQDIKENSLLGQLEAIVDELVALRSKNADLEAALSELQFQFASEKVNVVDLASKLSTAEAKVRTLSVAGDSVVQTLKNQYAAAEAQLSELYRIIMSKDPIQKSSSSQVQNLSDDMVTNIKTIQARVLEIHLGSEEVMKQHAEEVNKGKLQSDVAEREVKLLNAEVERLKEKLSGQGEFIKKHTMEWTRVVDNLKSEVVRLGGADPKDEGEKLRKSRAAEQVKEIMSQALARSASPSNPQTSMDAFASSNPLLSLATFQVDLLVNSKVHSQLRVAGHCGGLCQAALHYFHVDPKTGSISFENAMVPGSQSSNLLVDLFLLPVDDRKGYQSQAGDVLGLCIKVSALHDPSPREILSNSNIVRTDEVMEAIHGQMIQNFSLWPDLLSSWRWEHDTRKSRWSLVSIRWRFLLKNVFPDLSAPLQALTLKDGGPRSSSIHML